MHFLTWLIEECNIEVDFEALPLALLNRHYNAVIFLLKHNVPLTSDGIPMLFDSYRGDNIMPIITSDVQADLNIYNIYVDQDVTVTLYIRLVSAFLTRFDIPFTDNYLWFMITKLSNAWMNGKACAYAQIMSDVEWLLTHHTLVRTKEMDFVYAWMIIMGIKLPGLELKYIDMNFIKKYFERLNYVVIQHSFNLYILGQQRLQNALSVYPNNLKDVIIEPELLWSADNLELLLNSIPYSVSFVERWGFHCVKCEYTNMIKIFIKYITKKSY